MAHFVLKGAQRRKVSEKTDGVELARFISSPSSRLGRAPIQANPFSFVLF